MQFSWVKLNIYTLKLIKGGKGSFNDFKAYFSSINYFYSEKKVKLTDNNSSEALNQKLHKGEFI